MNFEVTDPVTKRLWGEKIDRQVAALWDSSPAKPFSRWRRLCFRLCLGERLALIWGALTWSQDEVSDATRGRDG